VHLVAACVYKYADSKDIELDRPPLIDDCFDYHSRGNNVIIVFSSFLTELHIANGVVCVVCPFCR